MTKLYRFAKGRKLPVCCPKSKTKTKNVNRPKCYVWMFGFRLLYFPLSFSEEKGFLKSWLRLFITEVNRGSLSWATCRLVAPEIWGSKPWLCPKTECQGETSPGGELPCPLQWYWVVGCQKYRQGLLSSQFPALSREEGTGGGGDGQFVLDMNWILTLVHLSEEIA